jgi:phage terminase small subunit
MATGRLTAQREAFVLFYLGGKKGSDGFRPFHGTKAAIAAGYSPKSAHAQASELLKDPKVSARIREELDAAAVPAKAVLNELADIAMAEWRDFLIITDWDDAGNPARFKMDMRAKVDALELIGKHHQLFTDNLKIDAAESFMQALREFGKGAVGGDGDA